jgi:hypothetical protein
MAWQEEQKRINCNSLKRKREIYKVFILKSKRDGEKREEIEWATTRMLGLLLHRPRNCSWRLEKFVGGG